MLKRDGYKFNYYDDQLILSKEDGKSTNYIWLTLEEENFVVTYGKTSDDIEEWYNK